MANVIEIILRAIDQASTVIGKVEANTVASGAAIVKGFDGVGIASDAVNKKLGEYGAALDDVTREQNKLKQAQYDAQEAAQKLAQAQKNLAENTDPKQTEELNRALIDAQVNLDKTGEEVQKLSKNLRDGKSATDEAKGGFSSMQAALVTANQAIDLVGRGIGIAKDVIDQTVGSTVAYAKQVRELSTNLGISAEETSKIIQASDDYGISVETVTGALEMAVKRGFAPNIETLAKLADEYNSISDPIQRAARLSDVFGRGWTALTPILSAGGKAIRDAASEAEKLGLVLSDKDVQGARALEISIDNLNDRVDALKLKMGKDLVPVAVNVTDALTKFTDIVQGTESPLDAMNRQLEYMKSFYGDASPQVVQATKAIADYKQMLIDVAMTSDEKALRSGMNLLKSFDTIRMSASDLERGIRNQADVYAVLDTAMDKTSTKTALLASNQKLAAQELEKLKVAMAGAIKNEDKQYGDSQEELRKRLKETGEELRNLQREQGSVDKSTVKNAMSSAELAAAQANLAAAQARLAKETDPLKQQQLAASIAVQQEKITGANQAVVTYVDNSKRIAELKGQYDDINIEISKNATAHEEATKRILYGYAEQAIAQANAKAGITAMTDDQVQALDKLAVELGLKSESDVRAYNAILAAAQGLQTGGTKAIDDFVSTVENRLTMTQQNAEAYAAKGFKPIETAFIKSKETIEKLGGEPVIVKTTLDPKKAKTGATDLLASPEMKKLGEPITTPVTADTRAASTAMQYFINYSLSPASAYYATLIQQAQTFNATVSQTPSLPSYTNQPIRPPQSGPQAQRGADFVVPPGYPGDSFPMRVSSGERVQVTPAGQGGGNIPAINITQNFSGAQSSPEQYRSIMYEVITDVFDKAMRQ